MIDPKAVIEGGAGFVATLAPVVVHAAPDGALLRLDAGAHLHNHVGGPHAAAIFGLGETAAFAVLLAVFGDLVEAGVVPLVKESTIAYSAIATGPLLAAARLLDDEASARASVQARGRATFGVEVLFRRESDDVQTAAATYRMALLRM